MGDNTEEFNTLAFEKKLLQLKDTQESIQGLSAWCLKQRSHHKKIVSSWLNVLKRVKIEQRLVLFYLANDVIQYSKRKNYEFVESWGLNLQKATPLVRDEKVRPKILRILKIWEERSVYDDEFLSDLTGLLSAGAVKKTDDDPLDFQPQQLVNKIKQCQVLEADTDSKLKQLHDSPLDLADTDALCANLKERCMKEDVESDLKAAVGLVERYTAALQREIVAREALLALLASAAQYYSTQRGEVKVVAYAYKNFGARVRGLKRKLDEMVPALAPRPPPRAASPRASPDPPALAYDIDRSFNTSIAADGSLYNLGLSSFLSSENPLNIFNDNGNKIEVINSRPTDKPEFNILNEFLKNLSGDSNQASEGNNSVTSVAASQRSQDSPPERLAREHPARELPGLELSTELPGLDLMTSDPHPNPAAPTSFYGSIDQVSDEPDDKPYHPENAGPWTDNAWNVTSNAVKFDTPQSPPLAFQRPEGALPPPPPPPLPLLAPIADVDHRMLLPPPHHTQDVDHRNLIPLTQQPPAADQDYRVPVPVPVPAPADIVEAVDMDLSEDEEQQSYKSSRFNNKVLVGAATNADMRRQDADMRRLDANTDMRSQNADTRPHNTDMRQNTEMRPHNAEMRVNADMRPHSADIRPHTDMRPHNTEMHQHNADMHPHPSELRPHYPDMHPHPHPQPADYYKPHPRWAPRPLRPRWGPPRPRFW